jgi:hypothetical protein
VAQLQIRPLSATHIPQGRLANTTETYSDTVVSLPFWDDFSITGERTDSLKWSINQGVKISNSYGINAPSIYQAVFDGVNVNGAAYSESTSFNGAGDSLVSQSINLSNIAQSRRNTVYLSFYYQIKGLGEIPEETDSLQLRFFRSDSTWVPIDINPENPNSLALTGGIELLQFDEDSVLLFNQVIVPVQDPAFFHRNFKFKFVSYSNLSGIYDTWIIDYIYLNIDREPGETTYRDRSISSSISSPFTPYHKIPTEQFSAFVDAASRQNQHVSLTNLETGIFTVEYNHILRNLNSGQVISSGSLTDDLFINVEFGRTVEGISPFELSLAGDSVVIESEFYYNTGDTLLSEDNSINQLTYYPIDLRVNDTLRTRYTLQDQFAYDDGSAEFAAGINLLGGKLAVEYTCYESDTLTAIDVYFPQISPTNAGETVDIIVWLNLENEEGDEEILRRFPYTIESKGSNEFTRLKITDPLLLEDTFYIGYVQFTDNFIGLGFDKNSLSGSNRIFFNTERQWIQNERISGSLMIRPVFESQSEFVLDAGRRIEDALVVFPNPSENGLFQIKGEADSWLVTDLSGKSVAESTTGEEQIDLSREKPGMYFLHYFRQGSKHVKKLIIK